MRNLRFLLMISIVALFFIGCSSSDEPEEEETKDTSDEPVTLEVAFNAQPPTMDPLMTTAVVTRDITRHIYESLVTMNENYEVEPMLAESYDVSEDGKTLTFKLREGIKFHNGEEMTVEDVVASLDRWRNTAGLGKTHFSDAEISAEGDDTVVIELEERMFTALHVLADPGQAAVITPKEIVDAATEEGMDEFIGTGPFKFEDWVSDQYISVSKFADYQPVDEPASGLAGKKEAKVDEIKFHFVTDASTRVAGIKSGEYDIANAISFDDAEMLETDDEIVNHIDHNGFNAVVFNKKQGFFTDKLARQAVNAALDQEAILQAAFNNENFYELEHGLMIKDQVDWYSEAGADQYNQKDLDKAKQLLDEAGYDGEELTIVSTRDYQDHYDAAVVVHSQLEDLGLNVNLDLSDWATVLEKREDENAYDIFITGFPTEPIPSSYVFLDSRSQWPGWTESEELDQYLDAIQASESQEEAQENFSLLQETFYDYMPIIKFGNKTTVTSTRTNIDQMGFLHGVIFWNVEKN
ncbi:MAG TPA: ABC transporter substrate-binding protein [Bacillota bacterium]|nr:ABC transporter substrate-binding protein [Bacillota bacterium]